jgi:hypothetical protein
MKIARPTSTHVALVITTASLLACLGGGEQPAVCADYLDCAGENTPEILPTLTPTYGEDGSCWKEGKDEREACEAACDAALTACEADTDTDTDSDSDTDTDTDTDTDADADFTVTWDTNGVTIALVGMSTSGFDLGIAETASGDMGWYGEDCLTGDCHIFNGSTVGQLDSVYEEVLETGDLGYVVPGQTTLFDRTFASDLTYAITIDSGDCFVKGQDPSYYLSDSSYAMCQEL